MNDADIETAFAAGRIDAAQRRAMREALRAARARFCPTSPVSELLGRIRLDAPREPVDVDGPAAGEDPDVARMLSRIPGAQHRPGLLEVFRAAHRGRIRDVTDASLAAVDPVSQIRSLERAADQPQLAVAVRDVWSAMQTWLDRGVFAVPRRRGELRAPAAAETVEHAGIDLAVLPIDARFAALYGARTVDQTFALFRRVVERMGRHFADAWKASPAARTPEMLRTRESFRGLRSMSVPDAVANGFASGVADVVNPLHHLMCRAVAERGPDAADPEFLRRVGEAHLDFSVLTALFGLESLVALEKTMRRPPSAETAAFVRRWSRTTTDLSGNPFPLDCHYDARYFAVRDVETEPGVRTPIVDFEPRGFAPEELAGLRSRTIRLGCPSLGQPHRRFTEAMCRAYFAIVLPQLIAEQGTCPGPKRTN